MRKELPDQLAVLRLMLSDVNAEWRDLARQSGSAAKLSRMGELRTQRLALMTRIFNAEQSERLAG
jgi:antitoxin component HigA of HigAB toxin-antitoxin module